MNGTIFWDVDTQVDFMRPEGRLYVQGAEEIIPPLKRLTEWAKQNRILVVSSACAHQEGDEEFQMYPPHCIAGTPGQAKIPETTLPRQRVIPNRPSELPSDLKSVDQIVIEKQKFDVFTNPNTESLLRMLDKAEITLYGVVTEICVAAAARGMLDRGFRIRVVRDAIKHIEEPKAKDLLQEVERRGGTLVTTEEAVGKR